MWVFAQATHVVGLKSNFTYSVRPLLQLTFLLWEQYEKTNKQMCFLLNTVCYGRYPHYRLWPQLSTSAM